MFRRLFGIIGSDRIRRATPRAPTTVRCLRIEPLESRYAPACTFQDPNIVCDAAGENIQLHLAADHSGTQVIINSTTVGSTQSPLIHVDGILAADGR